MRLLDVEQDLRLNDSLANIKRVLKLPLRVFPLAAKCCMNLNTFSNKVQSVTHSWSGYSAATVLPSPDCLKQSKSFSLVANWATIKAVQQNTSNRLIRPKPQNKIHVFLTERVWAEYQLTVECVAFSSLLRRARPVSSQTFRKCGWWVYRRMRQRRSPLASIRTR